MVKKVGPVPAGVAQPLLGVLGLPCVTPSSCAAVLPSSIPPPGWAERSVGAPCSELRVGGAESLPSGGLVAPVKPPPRVLVPSAA